MRSILLTALLLTPSLAFADHHEAPADEAPADEAPADEAPADEAPADEAPADDAPADEAPTDEAPADEAPADETPADEGSADEAPADEAAVEAAPTDEAPADEAAVEAAPTDEAPADAAPADEAAVEAAPADEAAPAAAAAAPVPAPIAQQCTYEDLQGQFTITVDCSLLQDFTGHSQPHKRIWLGGAKTQFNLIEVPDPYRTVELDVLMDQIGRDWGSKKTPAAASGTTFAGIDAMAVTENKQRSTSTTWVFNLNGRNVIANAVALGWGRFGRRANLEELTGAVLNGFKLGAAKPRPLPTPVAEAGVSAGEADGGASVSAGATDGRTGVSVGARSGLSSSERAQFEELGLAGRIERALGPWLARQDPEGGVAVTVTVRDFRLRATGLVAVTGMYSGPDYIEATVRVVRGAGAAREFDIKGSVVSIGYGIKESARLKAVVDKLAEEFETRM